MNVAPKTYQDAVSTLAESHGKADSSLEEIWSVPDPSGAVVRLIEVSSDELPSENGQVQAVRFGKSSDFPFASEIALLSRADWDRVLQGSLKLPPDWGGSKSKVWERLSA